MTNHESQEIRINNFQLIFRSSKAQGALDRGFSLTNEEKQILFDRRIIKDTTCPADIQVFATKLKQHILTRIDLRLWEEILKKDLHQYAEEVSKMYSLSTNFTMNIHIQNCKILKLINMKLKLYAGDLEKLRHEILQIITLFNIANSEGIREIDYLQFAHSNSLIPSTSQNSRPKVIPSTSETESVGIF